MNYFFLRVGKFDCMTEGVSLWEIEGPGNFCAKNRTILGKYLAFGLVLHASASTLFGNSCILNSHDLFL